MTDKSITCENLFSMLYFTNSEEQIFAIRNFLIDTIGPYDMRPELLIRSCR